MHLFRITRKKYAGDLSGEGARIYGGRWNRKGVSVIYTSGHESLAALEVLTHTSIADIPKDLEMLVLFVPDDIRCEEVSAEDLPENWRVYPAPQHLAEIGIKWALYKNSLLLKVPSVIIPTEFNYLINPIHPDFSKVSIKEIRAFSFDDRLRE
ncbi:MAG: RES family NAD+ phosphorylase [Balneolaceae bacterium]